ncbi:hypothetical protein SK128_015614, partial [Halocaridina rubra]
MLTKMAAFRITLLTTIIVSVIRPSKVQALSVPALDPESLPNTNFSCIGKVIGGYYADVYTGCQMFHVCTLDEKGEIHDYKFGCIPGTVFDQETRVCERADEVDCSISESFFYLNNELYGPGIIPPTADTAATSSAATVQVLDPSVALNAATISPSASDTSTGHSSSPPPPPTIPSAAPPPSHPIPTSSPPPPVIPPGVTASSASSTSRMSTSTSSSVTAAYSYPPLPFTVSRTSTSVSASSRVRIQTPLAQISLNQGFDPSVLPAPHLRPSLLRLAAQAQNSGQTFGDLNPTPPSLVISRTPADFEDVPRLAHRSSANFNAPFGLHSIHKRQITQRRLAQRNRAVSPAAVTLPESQPLNELSHQTALIDNDPVVSLSNIGRTTSRGRKRFMAPPRQGSTVGRGSTTSLRLPVQSTFVESDRVQGANIRLSHNNGQNRDVTLSLIAHSRDSSSPISQKHQESFLTVGQPEILVQSQQDNPMKIFSRLPISQHADSVTIGRPRITTASPPNTSTPAKTNSHMIGELLAGDLDTTVADNPSRFTETLFHPSDPHSLNDPTPVPPTVLTADIPPDSVHRVSADAAMIGPDLQTTTTQPAFVFPVTSFSCNDKVSGGLYADTETGCAVFHICSVGPDSSIIDNKFVCGNGTLFDQKSRTCQTASAVDCSQAESLFYLNDRLKGP